MPAMSQHHSRFLSGHSWARSLCAWQLYFQETVVVVKVDVVVDALVVEVVVFVEEDEVVVEVVEDVDGDFDVSVTVVSVVEGQPRFFLAQHHSTFLVDQPFSERVQSNGSQVVVAQPRPSLTQHQAFL